MSNLYKAQAALETFCVASGAKVNWCKSMGFWVSARPLPSRRPSEFFRWIQEGVSVRYLGCQVGINVNKERLLAPLMLSLRKKLMIWDTIELSLAGRVMIANQVLLSSMWYIASTCLFSRSCLLQIQRMVRNFIWIGRSNNDARAKVAWSTLTTQFSDGGLGLVDPDSQCKALLAKFVVRAMLPGQGIWSNFLLNRLFDIKPSTGGSWKPSLRWAFLSNFKMRPIHGPIDGFMVGICKAWEAVKFFLTRRCPSSNEELLRQPLIWNFIFSDERGVLLGSRPRLQWATLDSGIAATVASWGNYVFHMNNLQLDATMCRGFRVMFDEIQSSLGNFLTNWSPSSEHVWFRYFTPVGVIIGVKGTTSQGNCYYFDVSEEGRLWQTDVESSIWQTALEYPVRVIAKSGKTWILDPSPSDSMLFCQLWVFKKKSLLDLHWDPSDYLWKHTNPSSCTKLFQFFQYSVKLGRKLLLSRKFHPPSAMKVWLANGASLMDASKYWKWLWSMQIPRKIVLFRWLLMHYALPVRAWLRQLDSKSCGFGCGCMVESIKHVLWSCPKSRQIWQRVLKLLILIHANCVVTWGAVRWGILEGQLLLYEKEDIVEAFHIVPHHIQMVQPFISDSLQFRDDIIWKTISSVLMWVIWKARCASIFDNVTQDVAVIIAEFWLLLVHTLRGQYESFTGNADAIFKKQTHFKRIWTSMLIFREDGDHISWMYTVPVILGNNVY